MSVKSQDSDRGGKDSAHLLSTEIVADVGVAAGQTNVQDTHVDGGERVTNAELQKLAMVALETSDSVIITDRNFMIEWSNAAASRITGYSAEELRGQDLLVISRVFTMSPEVALRVSSDLPAGKRFAATAWTVRKNGERLLAEFEMIPYRDENGEVDAFIGITHDITARRLAEDALRESEEHLRDAQELGGFGSWRYLVDTHEIRWSPHVFRTYGRSIERFAPTIDEFFAYIREEDRETTRALVLRAMREGTPYNEMHSITREDGTVAYIQGRGNVRRDATGRIVELYGTCQDITERVLAEKARLALQERFAGAQRLESLGLLAGGVAHDFNNLLMGVMMDASLLEREVAPRTPIADAVANIQEAAMRMADLTNQLLAYAGRGRFVVEHIDPNGAVTDMLKSLRQNLKADVSIESLLAQDSVTIAIDASQLRLVLTNLVLNAADALEGRPGKICIRSHIEKMDSGGGTWVLEVTDSGAGMTEDVQQRIFEPFFTTKQAGRGLGLSTAFGLIQRSKGTIDVQSTIGRGTTFYVRLPLVNEQTSTTPARAPVHPEPRPLRILVADDEPMVRRSLRRMLELNRAQVIEVGDGAAAIEAINHEAEPFDIALLDIVMPRMSGYDVLSEVRTRRVPTKIILMSGYDKTEHDANATRSGHHADAILQKPFAWDELKRLLNMVSHPDVAVNNEKQ